jgi:hypothetical protein
MTVQTPELITWPAIFHMIPKFSTVNNNYDHNNNSSSKNNKQRTIITTIIIIQLFIIYMPTPARG